MCIDLLKKDGELRSNEELESQNIHIDWWPRAQLESNYCSLLIHELNFFKKLINTRTGVLLLHNGIYRVITYF